MSTPRDMGSPIKGTPKLASPDAMDIDQDVDAGLELTVDPLQKLKTQDLIPEVFGLLHDLHSDKMSAKDFDNNAGSIRLKLNYVKQYLRQINGITETVEFREEKIEMLKTNNRRKAMFLEQFKEKVNKEFVERSGV